MIVHRAARTQLQDLLRGGDIVEPTLKKTPHDAAARRRSFFERQQQRKHKFEEDYPAFLLAVASALRTGLDPFVAIESVETMLPPTSLLRHEIERFRTQLAAGVPEEEAIFSFASTVHHPDVRLFTTALLLARREGSSLGGCLQRLNRFTRQRQAFRRKAKSAVAMQRLSSFGIIGCSLLIGVMQIGMNQESFFEAWHHPLGRILLASGGSLLAAGFAWILYLGRTRL